MGCICSILQDLFCRCSFCRSDGPAQYKGSVLSTYQPVVLCLNLHTAHVTAASLHPQHRRWHRTFSGRQLFSFCSSSHMRVQLAPGCCYLLALNYCLAAF